MDTSRGPDGPIDSPPDRQLRPSQGRHIMMWRQTRRQTWRQGWRPTRPPSPTHHHARDCEGTWATAVDEPCLDCRRPLTVRPFQERPDERWATTLSAVSSLPSGCRSGRSARSSAVLSPGMQAAVAQWLGSQGRIRWPRVPGAPVVEAAPARLAAWSIRRAPLLGIGTEPIGGSRRRRTPSHVLPLHRNTVNTAVSRTQVAQLRRREAKVAVRTSTPDPLHAIDARGVHVAMRHLTYPRNRAGGKALPRVGSWGGVRLRVAQFLANLWHARPMPTKLGHPWHGRRGYRPRSPARAPPQAHRPGWRARLPDAM